MRRLALEGTLALAEGSRYATPSVLAPDVQTWLAGPEEGVAAVQSARGVDATAAALARLAPSSLAVADAVCIGDACWAEITRRGDRELETCIVGVTCDAAGAVSRLVWLRAPFVPASDTDIEPSAPDGRPILERYFADLMRSRFRQAAAHFAPDTLYSHPPYGAGTGRVLFRGREALWRGFVTERGASPVRQVITAFWQRRSRVFVEGVIEGIPDGGTFFSTAQISSAGEIARYVAFYSRERIPSAS